MANSKKPQEWLTVAELRYARKVAAKAKGSRPLPAKASTLEKNKYELCRQFVVYMRDHNLTQRGLAKRLHLTESRVSSLVRYEIAKFSLDMLVELHDRIKNRVILKVA